MEAPKDDRQALANKVLMAMQDAAHEAIAEAPYADFAPIMMSVSLQLAISWAVMICCDKENLFSDEVSKPARDFLSLLPNRYVDKVVDSLRESGALKPQPEGESC